MAEQYSTVGLTYILPIAWVAYLFFGHYVTLLPTLGRRFLCRPFRVSRVHTWKQECRSRGDCVITRNCRAACHSGRPASQSHQRRVGSDGPTSSPPLAVVCPRESGPDVRFRITHGPEYVCTCLPVICVSSSEKWQFEILYPSFNCLFTVILSDTQIRVARLINNRV